MSLIFVSLPCFTVFGAGDSGIRCQQTYAHSVRPGRRSMMKTVGDKLPWGASGLAGWLAYGYTELIPQSPPVTVHATVFSVIGYISQLMGRIPQFLPQLNTIRNSMKQLHPEFGSLLHTCLILIMIVSMRPEFPDVLSVKWFGYIHQNTSCVTKV